MPDSDGIIVRVGADIGSLTAGMAEASASVDAAMKKVADATVQATVASVAYQNSLKAAKEYMSDEATASAILVPAIQQQATATQALKQAKLELRAAQRTVSDSVKDQNAAEAQSITTENEVTAATQRAVSSRQAATAGIGILEGRMMSSNRAAAAFLSTTLGLGPVLQAAFPVIGAIALLEVFVQLGHAIGEATDYLAGWDAEVKKSSEEAVRRNIEMIGKNLELRNAQAETAAIGLHGAERLAAQEHAVEVERKNTLQTLQLMRTSLADLQKTNDQLSFHMSDLWTKAGYKIYQNHEQLEINKRTVEEFTRSIQELEDKLQFDIPKKQMTLDAESRSGGDPHKAARDQMQAMEQAFLEQKAVHAMSLEDEEQFWISKLEIAKRYPENYQHVLDKVLNFEVQAQNEMKRLTTQAQDEMSRIAEVARNKEQEEQQQDLERYGHFVEEKVKRMNAAIDKILEDQVRANDRSLENDQQTDNRSLAHHRETLSQWVASSRDALERWHIQQDQIMQQIINRDAQLYGIDDEHYKAAVDRKEQIDRDYEKKKGQIDQQIANKEEQLNQKIATELASNINAMLMHHQSFAKSVENIWQSLVSSFITRLITDMVEKWALGHLLMEAEDKLFTALHLENQVAMSAAQKAHMAANNATNVGEAQSAAALAAANTLAWWSAINPPVAPAMASVQLAIGEGYAGMAAFETGTGYVPRTGAAFIHEGEAIVPAPTMKDFRMLSSSVRSTKSSRANFNTTVNNHGGGTSMTEKEITKTVRRAYKLGKLN